jgi:SPOR domain
VRLALLMLLVANVVLAILGLYASDSPRPARDIRANELAPERIRILSPRQASPEVTRPAGQRPDGQPSACLEWGSFQAAQVIGAERAAQASLGVQKPIERRIESIGTNWWVYLPQQANRRVADRLAEDLRRAGVTDYYVVNDDNRYNNAVSLGLFSSEAAANQRREQIARLGFRDSIVQARDSTITRTYFRFRDVSDVVLASLTTLRGNFTGTDLRDCPK